jgi:dTDP-4-amino-4,6-dideoxygalactose transaminase
MSDQSRPVLLGGEPICPEGPPLWPLPDPDVQAALHAAIAAGDWGQYHAEHVQALETELAAFHGVPHALTCASGTLAVETALRAVRVGPGDEVILAAYDYEANFLTIHALGAKPVLVDILSTNWQFDPASLEAAFSPRTRAVLCSHLHGGLVPMREVLAITQPRGISVIEDAAQAPGAWVQGKLAGTWGDVGTLSFGGSKLLSAGRGGAILVRDTQVFQRARLWLTRGVQQWAPLSELQAAALRPQLRKLNDLTAQRLERVSELLRLLAPIPGLYCLATPDMAVPAQVPAFYKVGFQFDPVAFGLSRELFVRAIRAEGIAFDLGFRGIHIGRSPSRFRAIGGLPVATIAHAGCVVLHHPVLSRSQVAIQQVADAVAKLYRCRDELQALSLRGGS